MKPPPSAPALPALAMIALLCVPAAAAAAPDIATQAASGVPAAQPAAPGKGDPDDDDQDAARYLAPMKDDATPLPAQVDGCDRDVGENRRHLTYDYSIGTAGDGSYKNAPNAYGSGIGHRLTLRGGCHAGLMYEHLSSGMPFPNSTVRVDSLALIGYIESDRVWDFYLGLGETWYRPGQQDYALASLFIYVRRHFVWGLSGELSADMPVGAFFLSQQYMTDNPNDRLMNSVVDVALRYDWQDVALKMGVHSYQVSYTVSGAGQPGAFQRGVGYVGLTLKY